MNHLFLAQSFAAHKRFDAVQKSRRRWRPESFHVRRRIQSLTSLPPSAVSISISPTPPVECRIVAFFISTLRSSFDLASSRYTIRGEFFFFVLNVAAAGKCLDGSYASTRVSLAFATPLTNPLLPSLLSFFFFFSLFTELS